MISKKYFSTISFLIIIATIYFSFYTLMPKTVSDITASKTQFSTERALTHVKEIAQKPHYVGSPEHKNVQQYVVDQLRKLGLEAEIQQQVAVNKKWRAAANTQNILAKIKGTDSNKGLLLLSHYDSSPHSSLGASDAASGVATILEGVRAFIASGKQPKNDIIILISDAEELGLLGASAFVNNHPWAKNVGLVLNFEARGSGGPSYMLVETNKGNKNLIKHFKKANPRYPVASSLMYSIYKMLPNDTDLTIFREDGDIEGYNFAFIDDHFDYHTAQDTYKRLDKVSLEHQGKYMMPLLNYFADADLTVLKSTNDYVYFNFPFIGMVYYPFSWVLPLIILLTLSFIVLVTYGLFKRKLNTKDILKGSIPFFLSMLFTGLLAVYGWKFLLKIHPQYNDLLNGFTYNGHLYIAAFSSLALAILFLIYTPYFKKITHINLLIVPVSVWILINIAISIFLKGAGYFVLAALYGIISLAILLFSKKPIGHKQLLLTVLSIPILIILAPMVQMFPIGLGLKILVISTTFIILLFGLIVPVFALYKNSKKLGLLFLVLAGIIFISASFTSDYNEDRKKPNSIMYAIDADTNEAYWASYDRKADEFTKQLLGDNPTKGGFDNATTASKYGTGIQLHKKTELKNIPQPNIEINYDTIIGRNRNISITITPKRSVNRIELIATNNISFKKFYVNGIDLKKKRGSEFLFTTEKRKQILNYYITDRNEMVTLWFSTPKEQNPEITLYETSYDLLESTLFNFNSRNEEMIPKPFVINDAIIIKKQLFLNQK